MAKIGKNIENYQHVGNYTWQEAIKQGKGVGVLTTNPHAEMLTAKGHKKDISSAATKTYITVTYDEDYILDFIHRRIILGLNFMQGNELDINQYSKLSDKVIAYSNAEKTRESHAQLLKDALDMSERHGGTIEYWIEAAKNAAVANTEKAANSTEKAANSSNNKSREKVAA